MLEVWHAGLCAAAVVNAAAWFSAVRRLRRRAPQLPVEVLAARRIVAALSAVFVTGCAFRSALPMLDVQRICLDDTVLSRIAVGRSVATVAELAFVAQWALLLREAAGRDAESFVRRAALALLPLAIVAETFSWLGVLTRNNLLHAVENSLWTFGAAVVLAALVALLDGAAERRRKMIGVGIAAVAGYLLFMVTVDLPMYLQRWQAGGETLSLSAGMAEVLRRCVPVTLGAAWREDIPWLTLYFTVGVWLSIALIDAPPLCSRRKSRARGSRVPGPASHSDRTAHGNGRVSSRRAWRRS